MFSVAIWVNWVNNPNEADDEEDNPGLIKGKKAPLPLPWNKAYLEFWLESVDELARYFESETLKCERCVDFFKRNLLCQNKK